MTYTIKDEINDILRINKQMLKEEGLFYLLNSKNTKAIDFRNALISDGNKSGSHIKKLYNDCVRKHVISPEYRAEQKILYEQLEIFKGIIPLIDEVLELFFMQKFIGAYISLIPSVEGLLLKWSKESPLKRFKPIDFIKNRVGLLKKKNEENYWDIHNLELLEYIICDFFFSRSNEDNIQHMFNRNVVLHGLNDITSDKAKENVIRLFSIIDLIALCYKSEFPLEGGGSIKTKGCAISCDKYYELNQDRIKNLTIYYSSIICYGVYKNKRLNELKSQLGI